MNLQQNSRFCFQKGNFSGVNSNVEGIYKKMRGGGIMIYVYLYLYTRNYKREEKLQWK